MLKSPVFYSLLFVLLCLSALEIYQHKPYNFRESVVMVYKDGFGHGSGSIIKSTKTHSLVLTNKHVCVGLATPKEVETKLQLLEGLGRILCSMSPDSLQCKQFEKQYDSIVDAINPVGRKVDIKFNNLPLKDTKGTILNISKKYDLCVVKITVGNLPVIRIADENAKPGDHVTALGNPLWYTNHQTDGYVGDLYDKEKNKYQHHTAEFYPGSSGSPTVNDSGELVGVNTLGTQVPTGGLMVPLNNIKDFILDFI